MKRLFTLAFTAFICLFASAQTVSFTGRDADGYVELYCVEVINHTQGWRETIFWPDTTITIEDFSNMDSLAEGGECTLQENNPNPFCGSTNVEVTVPNGGEVTFLIADINGGVKAMSSIFFEAGVHLLRVTLATQGTYLFAAVQNGKFTSIKMLCNGGGGAYKIEYQETIEWQPTVVAMQPQAYGQGAGDQMEYIGYANIDGVSVVSKSVVQAQTASETVMLKMESAYDGELPTPKIKEDFRVALSLSPFTLTQFQNGYTFVVGDKTATTPEELQAIYRELGSTEMYARIATKRHVTSEDITDGQPDSNANFHTFDQGIELCKIAASLGIPMNPEIMCAYTYMDMDKQQAPRFDEYPEIYALQKGKDWSELNLDEVCTVLEAYGEFVAEAILNTGCTVNNWNLGNEANFGFAGISMGLKTAVNPKLEKASTIAKYLAPTFAVWWLKKNVWKYNAKAFAAVKRGILNAYAKLGVDASNVKFSTHIATVVFPARCSASYFRCMKENGYEVETAGISYYPSAPSMSLNRKSLLTKTITKINKKCGVPVFIGEFSYPSGQMEGPFAGWNKQLGKYEKTQQGQAEIYSDVVTWGKKNGMAGIRYWAPDYEGWYSMSMFDFADKKGTAKIILKNHKTLIQK